MSYRSKTVICVRCNDNPCNCTSPEEVHFSVANIDEREEVTLTDGSIIAYILMAILTFGVSWNLNNYQPGPRSSGEEKNTVASFGCALFWPFYWSVQITKPLRPKPTTQL